MEITFLQISASSYRTTNPPVSESRSLTVIKQALPFCAPRLLLQTEEHFNANERRAEYPLTQAQFDEITALFERLRLKELVIERLNQHPAPAPLPQPCGGSSRTVLTFQANSVTVTADDPPPETAELTQHLQKLRAAFAAEDPAALDAPDPLAIGFAPAPAPAPIPQPDRALTDGEWFCPNCGQRNRGAFCTECGTQH